MSCSAAPVGEVTMPIARGRNGGACFLSESNNPSPASFALSCSSARARAPPGPAAASDNQDEFFSEAIDQLLSF